MMDHDIVKAAWWLHRRRPTHLEQVSLPAETMARILGRACRYPGRNYLAHGNEGRAPRHVTCGLETVWRTGGDEVCAHVLATATDEELDFIDYVEEVMWRSHVLNQRAAGHEVPRNHAPTVWRDRKQLTPDEHQAFIDRMGERCGVLAGEMGGSVRDWRS